MVASFPMSLLGLQVGPRRLASMHTASVASWCVSVGATSMKRCDCGRTLPFKGLNEWGRSFEEQEAWERMLILIATATPSEIETLHQDMGNGGRDGN